MGIVDLGTLTLVRTVDVCHQPAEILVRPDGDAYVSCPGSNQVADLDVAHAKVRALIEVGKGADGLAWAPKY